MNIRRSCLLLLITVAATTLLAVASAAEPLAGGKIVGQATAAKPIAADDEVHGLFAKRLAQEPDELPTKKPATKAADEPADELPTDDDLSWLKPVPVRTALYTGTEDWRTDYLNRAASPPEPTLSESCGCTDGSCNNCDTCCQPMWCHKCGVFADLLYLRPGNIDYVYAVEQTGTLPTDSPTGPTGRVGFDGALGYRLGGVVALSDCSSIVASYTWFQDGTSSAINANGTNVLIFQPGLPSIPNVGASSVAASANYHIRFQQADIDYRGLLYGTQNSAVNYFAGLRYANLKQGFAAQEDIGVPVGLSQVISRISFDGFGIGGGLDGMRRAANCGLLVYGRASASFVSGEFKAIYREVTQFGPNSIIGNNLTDFRVMSILQAELGTGWQSCDGRVRLTVGYQFAGWFNALTVPSYILGVQNREFHNLNETITFDGLVTRVMFQF
jgi:hypothetical protein